MHVPLTERGRLQARAAADELSDLRGVPARLWTSDQARAWQTAEIIGACLDLDPILDARLREQALGWMEGKLASDLVAEPTPAGEHVSEVRWAGGESLADVAQRLDEFCDALRDGSPGVEIVVSHGDTLRVLRARLAGRSHRDVEFDVFPNGHIAVAQL